jgi:hypothetical protein
VIKAVRGAIHPSGVGRVIAHRRVVVSLTVSGFSLHDAHGPPINETISNTPYGAPADPLGNNSTKSIRIAYSMLPEISQSLKCGTLLNRVKGPLRYPGEGNNVRLAAITLIFNPWRRSQGDE